MEWNSIQNLSELPLNTEVRQVYIWLISTDNKYLLVSKNGEKYQQVGGHPEKDESLNQTLVREVKEETGLEITKDQITNAQFFGYYEIVENAKKYFQLRFALKLDTSSFEYQFNPQERSTEKIEDKINFAKFMTEEEAFSAVKWLENSKEYSELKKLIS